MKKMTAKARTPLSDFYRVKANKTKPGRLQAAALASLRMTCQYKG